MRKALDGQMPSAAAIEQDLAKVNAAIDAFARDMKAAMARKAGEGRTGWDDPTLRTEIYNDMLAHALIAEKTPGQEVHVANFAMMLHFLNGKP